MKPTACGLILFIHIYCLLQSCQVAAFGENCTDAPSVCTGNTKCTDGTCSTCVAGFELNTAKDGCQDIDECLQNNACGSNADCSNTVGSYGCTCRAGYSGDPKTSCSDIDDCLQNNICGSNADCKNTVGSYSCTCRAGYIGDPKTICSDIDECLQSNACGSNADCSNTIGSYGCTCRAGYSGDPKTSCSDIDECLQNNACGSNADCSNTVGSYGCTCKDGYSGDPKTSCSDIDECLQNNACGSNADCSNTVGSYGCTCKDGYSGDPKTSCSDIDECLQNNACGSNADCSNTVGSYGCTCKDGYSGDPKTSCSDIDECLQNNACGSNADCSNTVGSYGCTCKDGYSGDPKTSCSDIDECDSNPCKNGGTCSNLINAYSCTCSNGYSDTNCQVAALGSSCLQSGTFCADPNASCQSNGGGWTCQCKNNYYDSNGGGNIGGTCTSKIELGSPGCSSSVTDSCKSPFATCQSDGYCRCNIGYYDNNGATGGGTCTKKIELGSPGCSTTVIDSCKSPYATCQSNGYCRCISGYYDNNGVTGGGTCTKRKDLGKSCSNLPNECSDTNAQCLDDKCTCGPNYYDSNGFVDGGSCAYITDLRVKSISFSAVTTSGFTVSWTPPSSTAQINRYEVKWSLKTSDNSLSGGNSVAAKSLTSFVINTGVTAGKTYIVKVMSVNTNTRKDHSRTTFLSKEQASKPSIPGAVTSSVDDLDALDKNILIKWTAGNGKATMYKVKLLDGETEKDSKNTSNLYSWFSSVLNGHNYSVVITARSEQFNGDYIWSEESISSIKTEVQVPEAPRNGVCKSPKDSTITLNWDAPILPNGDLVRYYIDVRDTSNKLIFSDETNATETEKVVGNLQPGTNYVFRLYTKNEKYNSTSYEEVSSACKTRAKMSDPPTNLEVSEVTSRGFDISWERPNDTFSEENYGYVLQIKDDTGACWKEVIYRCSDCSGRFILSNLSGMCDQPKQEQRIDKTKNELAIKLMYSATLDPDIAYTVSVTAINDAGRGHPASMTQITKEEVPKTPYEVKVVDKNATAFDVTWKIDGPRPGKTNFLITLIAEAPALSKNFTVPGFDVREFTAPGLQEYWNYNVSVTASTSVGRRISVVTKQYRTLPAAPGKVSEFNIEDHPGGDYTKMIISWKMPTVLERNGIITSYKFDHFESTMVTSTKDFNQKAEGNIYSVTLDVTPEETYNFTVYAINEDDVDGEKHSVEIKAPAGVPINIEKTQNISIIPKEKAKNVGETKITVSFVKEFFMEETYGKIEGTGLIICSKKDCAAKNVEKLTDFDKMNNWKEDKEAYRPTNETWFTDTMKMNSVKSRRKRAVTNLEYTLGSDSCPDLTGGQYCNGPLQPGKSYYIFAVSCTNGGCLVSKENGPFITKAVPDEDANLGLIIGIVVAGVVIIVLVVVILVLVMRRRKRKGDGMKPYSGDDDDDDFIKLDPNAAKILKKRPILLNDIDEYVINMHKDSNLLFSAEYEDLKTISPKHSCEAADKEENRMKNRYINIIPFDHSRVKLSTNGEDDSNDYINANYLPGYISPREYIGCQGPIPGTIDDFWRMTWEQNVSVIVMLTLCKEGQKIKCEQYWPDEVGEPKQYGDVIVEITSYSNIRTYDYRMFKITNGNTTRVIKHFHFLSWLDFQANVHHDIILDFIQQVRQHVQPPDTSGPMIIHCSAGVGRTGTYIALDHLMQYINEHDFDVKIDVFDLVLKLRENRQHMVQTEQQYVFIHDCVKEIMERKRQMENIYENQGFWNKFKAQDENIYQNEQSLYANVSTSKSEQNTEL